MKNHDGNASGEKISNETMNNNNIGTTINDGKQLESS